MKTYYVYIISNYKKTVYYIGVTNNLKRRLSEHKANQGEKKTFAGRYYCFFLLYFEQYPDPNQAIAREKELKNLTRAKKDALISEINPDFKFIDID